MARRYPHQLSGGQQQRVGVARALAADPPVLLMDEPFSAVDPIVRASLQDELIRLQAELHKTIVMVTHDVEEAIKVGDIVAVFRPGGHLAQVDTPERLLGAPADDYVEDFVGFDRGIRRLSFFSAGGPRPGLRRAWSAETPPSTRRRRSPSAAGQPWVLVVDAERRAAGLGSAAAELAAPAAAQAAATCRWPRSGTRSGRTSTRCGRRWTPRCCRAPSGPSGVDADGPVLGVTSYERLRDGHPGRRGRRRPGPAGRGRAAVGDLRPGAGGRAS